MPGITSRKPRFTGRVFLDILMRLHTVSNALVTWDAGTGFLKRGLPDGLEAILMKMSCMDLWNGLADKYRERFTPGQGLEQYPSRMSLLASLTNSKLMYSLSWRRAMHGICRICASVLAFGPHPPGQPSRDRWTQRGAGHAPAGHARRESMRAAISWPAPSRPAGTSSIASART